MEIAALHEWNVGQTGRLIIAGPCAAESREQVLETAAALAAIPAVRLLRAGVWKPRTSPGCFEGVGEAALPWLAEAQRRCEQRPCIEVARPQHVELALAHGIRVLWIGARTTGSPFAVQALADAVRGTDTAILVKNPLNPDLALWIGALERMARAGVRCLAAVHRGFASPAPGAFRYSPMWRQPVELRRRWPALPILCDPSHITGRRDLVRGVCQAALDLDMDGLMVEVHPRPDAALSDAAQQLTPASFGQLLATLVRRSPAPPDASVEAHLEELRAELDAVDDAILASLAARWAIAGRIAAVKASAGVTALQMGRMSAVLDRWQQRAEALGLPADAVTEMYATLHEAVLNEQMRLMSAED